MKNPVRVEANCAYCGKKFSTHDLYQRFCSNRCSTLFSKKYNIAPEPEFEMSQELLKLQMTIQNTQIPGNDWNKEAGLAFYDAVFKQLTEIVKWMNTKAKHHEKHAHKESLEEMEKKLKTVLSKAADLKHENEELKKRLQVLRGGEKKLARTLLGLEDKAKAEQIKAAFKEKVKRTHPDTTNGDEDVFKAVKMAYEMIRI